MEPPRKRPRVTPSASDGTNETAPTKDEPMPPALDETALAFMASKLQDLPEARLPTDYPRTAFRRDQQMVESEESRCLEDSTCLALLKFSLMANVKPFTVVLAAFACLLRKYTHEEDVVIGSSSQSFNPLALRLSLRDTAEEVASDGTTAARRTLRDLVQHTAQVEEEAEAHEVPFNDLVNELRRLHSSKEDDLSSLFQVRFFNACDVHAKTLEAAWCDWNVYLEQQPDAKRLLPLRLRVVYNAVLYSADRMQEMLRQLEMVALHISSLPDSTYSDMSIRTEESVPRLPDPRAPLDNTWHGSVFAALSRWAKEQPDRPLVVEKDRTFSYREVDEASNRVAHYLVANGIEKEDVVALYAHRSSAMVVAVMGILKSGATLTVVDPAYPPARQNIYLSVARPRAILTLSLAGTLLDEVEEYVAKELNLKCRLDGIDTNVSLPKLQQFPVTSVGVEVDPDNIGTLSFTSGSTGIPKGVRGRHVSLTHFYPWMGEEFGISGGDRFTMLSGIAHDPIQRDIFTPIFFGATLHVPEAEDIGNPGQLSQWMRREKCTVTHLTPAMGQLLTANANAEMPELRLSFFVGDVLTKRDVLRLQALAQNITVVNMYGTTETQRAVSYLKVANNPSSMREEKDILPAGVGMKDAQLLVLSSAGLPCGIGELGEIYVRSPHLARGYLGLPDVTKAKFLQNPFRSDDTKDRMYRTGDLGRYNPRGVVECIGRADDQVKIRGFRIELREIDTYLGQHPHVRECVTKVRRDVNEEKILVSYFVPRNPKGYRISDMRAFLREKLAAYAVPTVFFKLARMPLTPNGKIDSRRLPAPELAPDEAATDDESELRKTLTDMELKVKKIWESVLGRRVGVEESFFDAGGHSILATQVTFKMRQKIGLDLPLNLLYAQPTVRRTAAVVEEALREPASEQILLDASRIGRGKGSGAAPAASNNGGAAPGKDDRDEVTLDVAGEIKLDDSIAPQGRTALVVPPQNVRCVFLTGASGFVGCFLLARLLRERPKATVVCLVRGETDEKARARLRDRMRANQVLDAAAFDARVRVVRGDLAQRKLGLASGVWDELGSSVEEIYHNGAIVHWVWPYHKLYAANVQSVEEVLRLGSHPSAKQLCPVFFVSSTSVLDSDHYARMSGRVEEDTPLQAGESLGVGYAQSKYVAEGICQIALQRGLPVVIFRPAYILGDSRNGVTNVDDYIIRLLKGCIQMGMAPRIRNHITLCSVDFLAAAVVCAAGQETSRGHCFHFCNPDSFRFIDMFQLLIDTGYDVKMEEYMAWRDRLMEFTLGSNDNALYPLLHFVLDDLPNKSRSPILDSSNLARALEGTDIVCPDAPSMFRMYLAFLVKAGYIPKPGSSGSITLPFDKAASSEEGLVTRTSAM